MARAGFCPCVFSCGLERNRSPLFIYKSLTHSCLEGCGPERIGQIVDAIDQMDSLSEDAEILQTMLFSAQEMKIDSDGRMLLPAEFIEFAGLDGTALFSGIGRSFQIWRPDRHQKRETDFRDRAAKQGVPRLTLGRRQSPESSNGRVQLAYTGHAGRGHHRPHPFGWKIFH